MRHVTHICRIYTFAVDYTMYTSIYLSSSIAVNLYMAFLRKNRSALPPYVKYLYFVVPMTIGLLHIAPQTIYAAKHGYCSSATPIQAGTKEYVIFVTLVLLLLPWLSVLFNIIISLWVLIWLLKKQRQVSKSLEQIKEQKQSLLSSKEQLVRARNEVKIQEYERQLMISRKANSTAIRIAFYPIAPLAVCIMITYFYAASNYITLTYKSDIPKMVRAMEINWYSYPVTTFINFLVFLTDPVMQNVIREVRICVKQRFASKPDEKHKKKKPSIDKIDVKMAATAEPDMTYSGATLHHPINEYGNGSLPPSPFVANSVYKKEVQYVIPDLLPAESFGDSINEIMLAANDDCDDDYDYYGEDKRDTIYTDRIVFEV
ncbi:hypothetical protein GGI12_004764 [Dipsacomyces acuminosporus]|nr:hypothetical protein GGI12_004764 [Dipsacomyces acuminosporus]